MIEKAQNKSVGATPNSKSEERRIAVQKEAETPLEEFYFSADDGRPPVTISARTIEEAKALYCKQFNLDS
jgi:hypothetical protein